MPLPIAYRGSRTGAGNIVEAKVWGGTNYIAVMS